MASPGGSDKDRGLIIVRGTFDPAKFKAKAEDAAKTNADALKIHKVPGGQQQIYETLVPGQDLPLFVAVANEKVLVASPGKDYVVDALKQTANKESAALKNKDVQALLEKMDDKQSLSVAGLASALRKDPNLPEGVKGALGKLDAIGGGVTVTDEVKLEFVLSAKTPQGAMEINRAVGEVLNQGLGMVALFASQKKELAPAIEIFKSIRSSAKGKLVTIKAQIGADLLDEVIGKKK
jgi:hypothetical protein